MASMSPEGVLHHCGTTEALVANETQPVMYCPQVVDDGALLLSILSAPRAVSISSEMPEGIGVMDPL